MIADGRLDRWLAALLSTPGLTAISDATEARRVHVEDALAAVDLLERGPVADVGSGGGSPGLPLAAARPELEFHLLEASAKKCAFLSEVAREFPNVTVIRTRAEDHARGAGRDAYGAAVARALATASVAVEWCLPLVQVGGCFVLYAGEAEDARAAAAAEQLGGRLDEVVPVRASERRRLLVFEKVEPTPPAFPRRSGIARKRPLA